MSHTLLRQIKGTPIGESIEVLDEWIDKEVDDNRKTRQVLLIAEFRFTITIADSAHERVIGKLSEPFEPTAEMRKLRLNLLVALREASKRTSQWESKVRFDVPGLEVGDPPVAMVCLSQPDKDGYPTFIILLADEFKS